MTVIETLLDKSFETKYFELLNAFVAGTANVKMILHACCFSG